VLLAIVSPAIASLLGDSATQAANPSAEKLMTHFLITMAGAFFGTIAAWVVLSVFNPAASSGVLATSAAHTPRSRWVALAAAAAFAVVAGLIFYFISNGQMNAGLGAIAAVVTLIVLVFVTRVLR
jgi:hypothetical protein